jgi:glycosyltransferase involved in cell wall biosynthesis
MQHPAPAPPVAVSVVVSTLDRPQLLARCVDALLDGTRQPHEIVVVDQGDPEPVRALLQQRSGRGTPLVHVVARSRGLSASQNAGVVRARAAAVSVVDDDCVPDARWVEVAAAQHTKVQGDLLLTGRVLPLPPEGDRTMPLSSRTSTAPAALPPTTLPWDVGTGGNFSVTRSAYLRVGGNDEQLGTGTPGRAGNDLDLFHRLQGDGIQVRFDPELLVLHERATPAEHRSRRWTYGFGLGACAARWWREGDRQAGRILLHWLRLRLRLVRGARRPSAVTAEVRVLLGTVHGLWYGWRLGPRDLRRFCDGEGRP